MAFPRRVSLSIFAVTAALVGVKALELFADNEFVKVVDDKAGLASEVFGMGEPVLLAAMSDSPEECPGCAQAALEFAKAAENLAGFGIKAVAVDCTGAVPKCHGLATPLQLNMLPAVRAYVDEPKANPYTKKKSRTMVPFSGSVSARALQRHVLGKVPTALLPRLTADSFPPAPDTDGPPKSLVLLFTDKSSASPVLKALAHHFRHRGLRFAEVDFKQEDELKSRFAVDKSPTLLVTLANEEKDDASMGVVYKGDQKDWAELTAFLEPYATKLQTDQGGDQGAGAQNGEAGGEAGASGLVAPFGSVALTSEADFRARVLEGPEAWVILYHSFPKDTAKGEEKAQAAQESTGWLEDWAAVASKCAGGGLVRCGEVNCTKAPGVCAEKQPHQAGKRKALPFMAEAWGYGLSAKEEALGAEYGESSLGDLEEAFQEAADSMPDTTLKVNAMTLDQLMMTAVQEKQVILTLFSGKAEPPAMLKQLALSMAGKALVAFFPDPDPATMQRLSIKKTPMFMAMFAQPGPSVDEGGNPLPKDRVGFGVNPYEPKRFGKPTYDAVLSFTAGVMQQVSPDHFEALVTAEQERLERLERGGPSGASSSNAGSGGGEDKGGGAAGSVEVPQVTAENWAELCPPSSAKLCAVAFLTAGPHAKETFQAELDVATAAFGQRSKDPYQFMWADGGCLTDFADSFDVQPSKLPTVVAYSPKKSRYASFVGVYGDESISDLLTGVLSGRVKTKTVFQQAPPDAAKNCVQLWEQANHETAAGTGEGGAFEEEALEEDFMAEILNEEAEAKRKLAAEVEAEAAAKAAEKEEARQAELAEAAKQATKKKKKAKAKKAKKKKAKDL